MLGHISFWSSYWCTAFTEAAFSVCLKNWFSAKWNERRYFAYLNPSSIRRDQIVQKEKINFFAINFRGSPKRSPENKRIENDELDSQVIWDYLRKELPTMNIQLLMNASFIFFFWPPVVSVRMMLSSKSTNLGGFQ